MYEFCTPATLATPIPYVTDSPIPFLPSTAGFGKLPEMFRKAFGKVRKAWCYRPEGLGRVKIIPNETLPLKTRDSA
jgi:hypothetical protein